MILKWIETWLSPKVSVITSTRYFQAFRSGFFVLMPLTIIGTVFMLITDFPIPGYNEWMSGIFGVCLLYTSTNAIRTLPSQANNGTS